MERETWFADVLLPLPLPGTFTYRIPYDLNASVKKGCRVSVQFGKQKIYTAIVYRMHQNVPDSITPKYILSLIDESPIVNEYQFKLWEWISEYYMSRPGEVMNAALPSALKLASESRIMLHPEARLVPEMMNEKEQLIAESLGYRKVLSVNEASELVEQKKIIPLLKTMIEKGYITLEEELKNRYKPKYESCVRLTDDYVDNETALANLMNGLERRAPRQVELLLSYFTKRRDNAGNAIHVSRADILQATGANPAQINALVKKGVFELYDVVRSRLGHYDASAEAGSIVLSKDQQSALKEIQTAFEAVSTVLLHGVTSSGKTEIYIRLIDDAIRQGKQVLFLLPEIALTAQIINRLRKYFGNRVGVYHSRYNENERVEVWNSVLNWEAGDEDTQNHFSIILGARSALFLPYRELGLIIVDEEHDTSYKQHDPAPRYHARDAAIILARIHNCKVVLGSATPALESYYNAGRGKYGLVKLNRRYGDIQLPEILVTDMRDEARKKRLHSHFSQTLLDHVGEALEKKEQVILFQNRRGFSVRLECHDCHWMPECKNCDVTLVYHKHNHSARCHYCGYYIKMPERCPKCSSTAILMKGFGTEKVEEELSVFFPQARIARMDLDTTRSRFAYQKIIGDFEDQKIDILVGTQMVTKGLDFDHVSVAGILSADHMLNFPDFRSHERAFQLMAQVSGRAGRKNKRGKVIIQTWDPKHPVINYVMENDYEALYLAQRAERSQFRYPPFYRLIRITLKHRDAKMLDEAASIFTRNLRAKYGNLILGPEYPLISRIKNLFLKNVLFKLPHNQNNLSMKKELSGLIESFTKETVSKGVQIQIDVDPY